MRYEVHKDKNAKNDDLVRLVLSEDGDGEVTVCAVDEEGDRIAQILRFTADGKIYLPARAKDSGMQTDEDGRVIVERSNY